MKKYQRSNKLDEYDTDNIMYLYLNSLGKVDDSIPIKEPLVNLADPTLKAENTLNA